MQILNIISQVLWIISEAAEIVEDLCGLDR